MNMKYVYMLVLLFVAMELIEGVCVTGPGYNACVAAETRKSDEEHKVVMKRQQEQMEASKKMMEIEKKRQEAARSTSR